MSCGAQTSNALGRRAVRSVINCFLLGLPSIPRAMLSVGEGWEGKGRAAWGESGMGVLPRAQITRDAANEGYAGDPVGSFGGKGMPKPQDPAVIHRPLAPPPHP